MRTYAVIGLAVCTLIVAGWSSRGRAEEPSAEQRRAEQRRADMDAELAKKQQLLELRRSESKLLKHAAMLKSEGRAVALNRKENELLAREKMLSVREAMLKVQERELALNRKENELLALEQKNQRVLKDIEYREASFKNVQVQIVDETSEREVAKRLRAELHKRALEREKKLEAQRKLSLDILSPLEKARLAWEAEKELEAKKEKERAEAEKKKERAKAETEETAISEPGRVLADFSAATSKLDVVKAERLFLPPDETPAGQNRQVYLTELRKDWKRLKASGVKEGPSVQFKNTKKVLLTQMVIHSPDAPKKGETREVAFTVALTEDGWKIVSMDYMRRK